jgi:hypothetical protein
LREDYATSRLLVKPLREAGADVRDRKGSGSRTVTRDLTDSSRGGERPPPRRSDPT